MTGEQMKEYVVNGGELFTITLIDTIRDGGTKLIRTTKDDYYIHRDSKKFYSSYNQNEENLITDFLLIEYLVEQVEAYIKRCEEGVKRNKDLLIEIQNIKH